MELLKLCKKYAFSNIGHKKYQAKKLIFGVYRAPTLIGFQSNFLITGTLAQTCTFSDKWYVYMFCKFHLICFVAAISDTSQLMSIIINSYDI